MAVGGSQIAKRRDGLTETLVPIVCRLTGRRSSFGRMSELSATDHLALGENHRRV